jgi:pSer/pThr/pTyr-binding forkhead associated (FHA) protein
MVLNDRILPYEPGALVQATHLYDIDFAAVGLTNAEAGDDVVTVRVEPYTYRKVILRGNRVAGALFIGDRQGIFAFKQLIDGGYDVASSRERLLDPRFDLADWMEKNRPAVKAGAGPAAAVRANENRNTAFGVLPASPFSHTQPSRPGLAGAASGAPRLVVDGRIYPLDPGRKTVIGRESSCDVVIVHNSLSRRHAEIAAELDGFTLRDLGSANGTWVGVTRLQPLVPVPLQLGDTIRLGQIFVTFQSSGMRAPTDRIRAVAPVAGTVSGPSGVVALTKEVTSFGRGAENDVPVPSQKASRLHAQIVLGDGGALYLYDMGSTNGTLVNGARIVDAHPLANGDAFDIGGVRYVFRDGNGPPTTGSVRVARVELTVVTGTGAGTRYTLRAGETVLGREQGAANTVVLADPQSSRRNTLILGAGDRYFIRDLNSRNGTRVNGNRLTQQQPLHDGDFIDIGQTRLAVRILKP